jgi:hypothetical protein
MIATTSLLSEFAQPLTGNQPKIAGNHRLIAITRRYQSEIVSYVNFSVRSNQPIFTNRSARPSSQMMILIEDAGALRAADTRTDVPSAVVKPPYFLPHPVYC